MKIKTIIKWIVGAIAVYAAYTFFYGGSKCEAQEVVTKAWQIDAEVGQYEKRIDTGAYTGDDASYVKMGTDLGVFGGLSFVGDLEYVNTDDYQLYTTVGTVLSTPIGALGVSGQYTSLEAADNYFEVGASYGLNLFGLDSVVAVTVDEDSQYSAEISTDYVVYTAEVVEVSVGGVYGQTFETVDDYDYMLGFVRVTAPLGVANLFAQVNYLNSDSVSGTDGEWAATTDFGVVFSF